MSAQTPFLVFSGTNSRYLAEKICNSLGCPLVSSLFLMKSLSAVEMYS